MLEQMENERKKRVKHTPKKSIIKLKPKEGNVSLVMQLNKGKKPEVDTWGSMIIPNETRDEMGMLSYPV